MNGILVSDRLQLIPVDPATATELAAGQCSLPAVGDYPHADSSTAARMARSAMEIDNYIPGYGMYVIVSSGLVVGDIGFYAPPSERGVSEVGYGLAPSARGLGYAVEALTCLINWAFANGTAVVLAETESTNEASQRVLRQCGFKHSSTQGSVYRFLKTRET